MASKSQVNLDHEAVSLEDYLQIFENPQPIHEKMFLFACNFNSHPRKDAAEQDALRMHCKFEG